MKVLIDIDQKEALLKGLEAPHSRHTAELKFDSIPLPQREILVKAYDLKTGYFSLTVPALLPENISSFTELHKWLLNNSTEIITPNAFGYFPNADQIVSNLIDFADKALVRSDLSTQVNKIFPAIIANKTFSFISLAVSAYRDQTGNLVKGRFDQGINGFASFKSILHRDNTGKANMDRIEDLLNPENKNILLGIFEKENEAVKAAEDEAFDDARNNFIIEEDKNRERDRVQAARVAGALLFLKETGYTTLIERYNENLASVDEIISTAFRSYISNKRINSYRDFGSGPVNDIGYRNLIKLREAFGVKEDCIVGSVATFDLNVATGLTYTYRVDVNNVIWDEFPYKSPIKS